MAVTNTTAINADTTTTTAGLSASATGTSTTTGLTAAVGAGIGADVTTTSSATTDTITGSSGNTIAADGSPVGDILGQYGITVEQAHDFLVANVDAPQTLYDAANQYGLSFADIGTIGNQTAGQVQEYFVQADLDATTTALANVGLTQNEAGTFVNAALESGNVLQVFDATQALRLDINALAEVSGSWSVQQLQDTFVTAGLDPSEIGGTPSDGVGIPLLPAAHAEATAGILTLNTNEGDLSTGSLREAVLDLGVSQEKYDAYFDASIYVGASDGTLSPDDLGTDAVGTVDATSANVESLFYGTTIAGFQAIDKTELSQIESFIGDNIEALHDGDQAVLHAYADLVVNAAATPTDAPALSDDELAPVIATTTAAAIGLAGDGTQVSVLDPTQLIPTAA